MSDNTPRPTTVRYAVVGVTTLAAVLLYLDRICISFAERFIKEDLYLSDKQMSWVLSAFFWSYALGQVPSGWLSDRFGARVTLTAYLLLWSVLTSATGLAGGLVSLLTIRLGFGLAQAGAYPTAAVLLSKWVPFPARAFASGVISFGGRVGGFLAPLVTGALIVAFVPITVSSRIGTGDLLDVYKLSTEIARPEREGAIAFGAKLLDSTDQEFRDTVARYAQLYADEIERIRREDEGDAAGWHDPESAKGVIGSGQSPRPSQTQGRATRLRLDRPRDADVAVLAAELNRQLDRLDLYDVTRFADVSLEREATQLAKRPREQLTLPQLQRLNRLLFETVYPKAIRKVYVAGWRRTMFVFGAAGIAATLAFWWICRNQPANHPWSNAAERELVEAHRPASEPSSDTTARGLPFECLLRSRSLWLSCVSQFGTNLGWVFLITWLPRYLTEVHRVPVFERSVMSSVPLFVGWFGMLGGGWLTDRLTRRLGLRWGRGLPMSLTRFVAVAAFLAVLAPLGPWSATIAFAVIAFATDLGVSSVWAYMQDVGGRHIGSILGWGNMWGNFGAALSPWLLNWMIERHGNWHAAFLTCAAAFLLSGIAAAGVDATKPIVPEPANDGLNEPGSFARERP